MPDATTTYAVRYQNLVTASIRVAAQSTGVRIINNDLRDAAAITDAGTSTVSANNTPGDFGSQNISTTGTLSSGTITLTAGSSVIIGTGFLSIGATPATAGNSIRLANNLQVYGMSSGGTPRALFELSNLSATRFTLDICGTAAAVAGVRLFGNGTVIVETGSQTNALGFFGVAPVLRQNLTGALTGVADANARDVLTSIVTALTNLGLTTNGTT